ncbi:hypothetical protein M8J75_014147 [Diaphorina citri]|nr:hypothetical protein M8J75_014147 [Diaphorina citri]
MGSPLSPLLSEFYMIEFEKEIFKLPPYLVNRIVYLYRYVDDVIILWSGTQRVLSQLMTSINQIWDNFSLDLEYGGDSINFLDLTISLVDQRHKFKIYRKDSFSDVIIPADSYHCHQHKMAVFRNYYNRLLEIPMDAESFEEERNTIRTIGLNNGYTPLELSKVYKGTVTVTVDNVFSEQGSTAGAFTFLTTSKAYIGGSENPRDLPGSTVHNNFVGCLRRVEIQGDSMMHNFIELAKSGNKGVSPSGHVTFSCPHNQPADPISFLTSQSHLVLPTWEAKHKGSIAIKFVTNEPNGLLIYSTGPVNTEQSKLATSSFLCSLPTHFWQTNLYDP